MMKQSIKSVITHSIKKPIHAIAIILLSLMAIACSSPNLDKHIGSSPELKLETFFHGEKSIRIWQLEKIADNEYLGQAADVIGTAKGRTQGSALYWQYDLEIEVEGETYTVTLDDWMFLMDQNRLFNKTEMTKFGFKVGEILIYIEKI